MQSRWDLLRKAVDESGGLVKGKVDTGLFSELRAHEQQAAQELDQWKTRSAHEERKTFDAVPR